MNIIIFSKIKYNLPSTLNPCDIWLFMESHMWYCVHSQFEINMQKPFHIIRTILHSVHIIQC